MFCVTLLSALLLLVHSFDRTNAFVPSSLAKSSDFSLFAEGRSAQQPTPIKGTDWPDKFPAKEHCSRCGLCETTFVSQVTEACAFLGPGMSRIDDLEVQVHGRNRNTKDMVWSEKFMKTDSDTSGDDVNRDSTMPEEARFGVMQQPIKLAKGVGMEGAQWTGVVSSIALSMLESGMVDAVVCIANNDDDDQASKFATPKPILARTAADVLKGRGVKPALAPSLAVLDEIKNDKSIRKLLFCGVGCAVQAFRAVQSTLNLEEVYVLGTNCADNSPTPKAAQNFLQKGFQLGDGILDTVQGYEFMQDFKVHVKTDNEYITKPYFCLPGTIAEPSIAPACLTCMDYTNGLADVVVGYMGAPLDKSSQRMDQSFQTLTVRNHRGAKMVDTATEAGRLLVGESAKGSGSHEQIALATVGSDSIVVSRAGTGSIPEKGMPVFVGNIMAFILSNTGPKGIGFARYSIDYHLLRNYLYLVDRYSSHDKAMNSMPEYAREIVNGYMSQDPRIGDLQKAILRR